MLARLFVMLQHILPRHWLTSVVYRVARVRAQWAKDTLIRGFIRLYDVNVDEVQRDVPDDFETFNDFFIRELKTDARPIDRNPASVVSPVDGTISIASNLASHRLVQAKGIEYSLDELFAIDLEEARGYTDGSFTTIYLAPYNYHRVHMPIDGNLVAAHYVPGDLFSVNDATVQNVPGLFTRNERLNLHFETAHGPASLIFVGALNVGSISTPWSGEIRPRKTGVVENIDLNGAPRELLKGDLLGWFNMGSTVILLLPKDVAIWDERLIGGLPVLMGEPIAMLTGDSA
jgi:phosphatidylserine decarboxylase